MHDQSRSNGEARNSSIAGTLLPMSVRKRKGNVDGVEGGYSHGLRWGYRGQGPGEAGGDADCC